MWAGFPAEWRAADVERRAGNGNRFPGWVAAWPANRGDQRKLPNERETEIKVAFHKAKAASTNLPPPPWLLILWFGRRWPGFVIHYAHFSPNSRIRMGIHVSTCMNEEKYIFCRSPAALSLSFSPSLALSLSLSLSPKGKKVKSNEKCLRVFRI